MRTKLMTLAFLFLAACGVDDPSSAARSNPKTEALMIDVEALLQAAPTVEWLGTYCEKQSDCPEGICSLADRECVLVDQAIQDQPGDAFEDHEHPH